MNLENYFDCLVKITLNDGRHIRAFVSDYMSPDENADGRGSIVLEEPDMEIFEDEIAKIEILEI